jgi:hypothetical protein
MGFLKQMKDMKNTLHEAPGMIDQARQLGAQAQHMQAAAAAMPGVGAPQIVTPEELEPIAGISLERYAQLAKAVGARKLQGVELDSFLVGNGHNPADWQAAYDGWNARMKANMGLSTKYGALYQQAAAL